MLYVLYILPYGHQCWSKRKVSMPAICSPSFHVWVKGFSVDLSPLLHARQSWWELPTDPLNRPSIVLLWVHGCGGSLCLSGSWSFFYHNEPEMRKGSECLTAVFRPFTHISSEPWWRKALFFLFLPVPSWKLPLFPLTSPVCGPGSCENTTARFPSLVTDPELFISPCSSMFLQLTP